ncbi:MAG: ABC transporter permease, partial [Proteobacteria bacterium]
LWGMLALAVPVAIFVFSVAFAFRTVDDDTLLAGFTPEFIGRHDGFLGLQQKYGFDMRTVVIEDAIMYKALYEHKLDVISGYSTDGRIKAFNLVALKDDKHIFPPYYAAPVVREEIIRKYPEVETALNLLSGRINDSIMTSLNYKADHLHQDPEAVAKEFLESQGLYKPARPNPAGKITIGSKIFGEQYILSAMYTMLIRGNTNLEVATKTGLGGTKICFDALTNNQIDIYPEYTGTAFLVLLQPDEKTVDTLIKDKDKVYDFVSREFQSRYQLKWLKPIGFNNAYVLMMRKEHARTTGVTTISQLLKLTN